MKSMRHLLIKYFFFLCLFPLLIIAVFKFFFLENYYLDIFSKEDYNISISTKALTEIILNKQKVSLKNLLSTHGSCLIEDYCTSLDSFCDNSEYIDNIIVLDRKGIIISIGGDLQYKKKLDEYIGMDFSGMDSYIQSKKTGNPSWSSQFYSIISGRLSLSYCLPFENVYIIGIFRIDNFYKNLMDIFRKDNIGLLITDSTGRIIQKYEKTVSFTDFSVSDVITRLENSKNKFGAEVVNLNGKKHIAVLQKIEDTGWKVIVYSDYFEFHDFLFKIKAFIVFILFLCAFVIYFISNKLSARIVAPIEKAVCYADEILNISVDEEKISTEYKEFEGFINTLKSLRNRVKNREYALKMLSMEATSHYDKDIFKRLSSLIADILGCEYSIIGYIKEDKVDVIDMFSEGEHIEEFVYDLKNTPCGEVIKTGFCVYSGGIQDVFPDDLDLQKLNVQSYIGLPVFNEKNKAVGIINAIFKNKRSFSRFDRDVLSIVASKVSSIFAMREKNENEKQRMMMFDRLINFMPVGIIVFDSLLNVININIQAKEALFLKERTINNINDIDFFQEELEKIIKTIKRDSFYNGTISKNTEGDNYYFDISGYKVKMNGKQFFIVKLRDVSENIRLNNLIIHDEKLSSLSSVGAGMAHELNNPIAGVLQSVQNVKNRLDPYNEKNSEVANDLGIDLKKLEKYLEKRGISEFLNNIEKAGGKAADIVEYLKEFAIEESDEFSEFKLSELIERSINILKTDYRLKKDYKSNEFEIIVKGENDLFINCIPVQLELAIYNVMKNSVQFYDKTAEKKPEIVIETSVREKELTIKIKDNGPGIDENVKKKVFNPFFTTRANFKGVGLTSSYFVVTEKHNGNIKINSDIGKGTEIIITIPI